MAKGIRMAGATASKEFKTACELASAQPTYRQWRKWNQGRGLAWNARKSIPAQEIIDAKEEPQEALAG